MKRRCPNTIPVNVSSLTLIPGVPKYRGDCPYCGARQLYVGRTTGKLIPHADKRLPMRYHLLKSQRDGAGRTCDRCGRPGPLSTWFIAEEGQYCTWLCRLVALNSVIESPPDEATPV